jgi:hypothetical protein
MQWPQLALLHPPNQLTRARAEHTATFPACRSCFQAPAFLRVWAFLFVIDMDGNEIFEATNELSGIDF